jgi:hypothetical protein
LQVPEPWVIDDPLGEISAWMDQETDDFTRELVWDFFFTKLQVNPLGFDKAVQFEADDAEYTVTVPGTDVAISYVVYRPPEADERLVAITKIRSRR